MRQVITDPNDLRLSRTHPDSDCADQSACPLHKPSAHHMRGWVVIWRHDSGILERLCSHGVGHPDPDQAEFWIKTGTHHYGLHGCCGCCDPDSQIHTTERTTPMNEPQYPPPQQHPPYPPPPYPYVARPPAAAYQQAPSSAASAAATTVVVGGRGSGPNHALHLLLTILSCGLWAPVWIFIAATHRRGLTWA